MGVKSGEKQKIRFCWREEFCWVDVLPNPLVEARSPLWMNVTTNTKGYFPRVVLILAPVGSKGFTIRAMWLRCWLGNSTHYSLYISSKIRHGFPLRIVLITESRVSNRFLVQMKLKCFVSHTLSNVSWVPKKILIWTNFHDFIKRKEKTCLTSTQRLAILIILSFERHKDVIVSSKLKEA